MSRIIMMERVLKYRVGKVLGAKTQKDFQNQQVSLLLTLHFSSQNVVILMWGAQPRTIDLR